MKYAVAALATMIAVSNGRTVQRFASAPSNTKCSATSATKTATMNSQLDGSLQTRPAPTALHHRAVARWR